ncbi:MAG: hypothetical protein ACXW19_00905 [Thermoanaerobaculia bacterium]
MLSSYVTTIVAAVISAFACGVVAQYGTPIDTALPLIAVIITIVAAISMPAIQLAVPLLMGGEILIADERLGCCGSGSSSGSCLQPRSFGLTAFCVRRF